jgi:hypothetical protein
MKVGSLFFIAALFAASASRMAAEGGPRWIVLVLSDTGTHGQKLLRIEVDEAPTLEECRLKVARAYTKVHGPIYCQHVDRAFVVDVYGNANPIF